MLWSLADQFRIKPPASSVEINSCEEISEQEDPEPGFSWLCGSGIALWTGKCFLSFELCCEKTWASRVAFAVLRCCWHADPSIVLLAMTEGCSSNLSPLWGEEGENSFRQAS